MSILYHGRAGLREQSKITPPILQLRCPNPRCRRLGSFEPPFPSTVADIALASAGPKSPAVVVGHRICPHNQCRTHVFVVHDGTDVIASYPPERIDFDASSIPTTVTTNLEEALTCHANECFTAAAMLIRKTLETLCHDKGCQGGNLRARIGDLGNKIIIPGELFNAIDDLRLLGNDAAHIEVTTYNDIGREEVDVAIDLTKEILKAVYQYSDLVNRLQALKKPSP